MFVEKLLLIIKFIGIALVCYIISSLIHELGHVVCGLLHHWKLFMLVVGPFKLYREELTGPIKFGFEKNIVMWGGVGGTFPLERSEKNIDVWSKILLAGPLTSLVFGALMGITLFVSQNIFLLFLTLMPIAMGLACLIPSKMKTGILYSDGTRYQRLHSDGQKKAEEVSIFRLIEASTLGGEQEVFSEEMIQPLLESKDYDFNYYGYYYSYLNAQRKGDEEAQRLQLDNMEQIQDKVSKMVREDCKIQDTETVTEGES